MFILNFKFNPPKFNTPSSPLTLSVTSLNKISCAPRFELKVHTKLTRKHEVLTGNSITGRLSSCINLPLVLLSRGETEVFSPHRSNQAAARCSLCMGRRCWLALTLFGFRGVEHKLEQTSKNRMHYLPNIQVFVYVCAGTLCQHLTASHSCTS